AQTDACQAKGKHQQPHRDREGTARCVMARGDVADKKHPPPPPPLSVMVWADEAAYQAGMQAIQAERAKQPDRERPTPTAIQRFEIYAAMSSGSLDTVEH